MSNRVLSALTVLALGSGAVASAQQHQPPRFPAETSAVVLDVIVRDKQGHMVRDLEANDFSVFEDGFEQTLDAFVVMARGDAPGTVAAHGTQPTADAPARPAAPRAKDQTPREPTLAVLVFDRLSPSGRAFAHNAAITYAREVHRPGDVVGVFTSGLALRAAGPFTSDREQLEANIHRAAGMAWAGGDPAQARADVRSKKDNLDKLQQQLRAAASGSERSGDSIGKVSSGLTSEQMAIRMAETSEGLGRDQEGYATTRALQGLIMGLAKVRGRKTVLLFSEGLAVTANVRHSFRQVIDAANKANVSVYAVDSAGLRGESSIDEARLELERIVRARDQVFVGGDFQGSFVRRAERAEDRLRLSAEATLEPLARETGGLFVADRNDVAEQLREMGEDMRFYYVLSYVPTNQDYDGRFRKLSVKVRRKGVKVRARRGYLALAPVKHDKLSSLL